MTQKTLDSAATYGEAAMTDVQPQAMFQAADDNFDELYGKTDALQIPEETLPPDFTAANATRIEVVNPDESAADTGVLIRRTDSAVGLDLWQDSGSGETYIDHRHNSESTGMNFRFKTSSSAFKSFDLSAILAYFFVPIRLGPSTLLNHPTVNTPTWQHVTADTGSRMYLAPNGLAAGATALQSGIKMFGTDYVVDTVNYDDFGIYNATDYCYINVKKNGTGAEKDIVFAADDTAHSIIKRDGKFGVDTLTPATKLEVNGAITTTELSADPADPAEGKNATWQSDGTGIGDDGDIMIKITAGGVTKTTTLVDFSSL